MEDLERREREEEGGGGGGKWGSVVATGGIKNSFAMPAIDYNGHLFLRSIDALNCNLRAIRTPSRFRPFLPCKSSSIASNINNDPRVILKIIDSSD